MRHPVAWREEPVSRRHDREGFDCGVEQLNDYLVRFARQNHESGGAKTFVAVAPGEPARVLGYYTISPASIEYARVPLALIRTFGRYDVPVFMLARLAILRALQGAGFGSTLLLAAGARALRASVEVGGVALGIDAKDAHVVRWYEEFGAMPLLDNPLKLVIPLANIARALRCAAGDET
jgi:GNAT superfamily N-acetyltransferase